MCLQRERVDNVSILNEKPYVKSDKRWVERVTMKKQSEFLEVQGRRFLCKLLPNLLLLGDIFLYTADFKAARDTYRNIGRLIFSHLVVKTVESNYFKEIFLSKF